MVSMSKQLSGFKARLLTLVLNVIFDSEESLLLYLISHIAQVQLSQSYEFCRANVLSHGHLKSVKE